MRVGLKTFWRNEEGATAVEYGLIAVVLSLIAIAGFAYAVDAIEFLFSDSGSKMVEAFTR